jgi:UrcA family protein
MQLLPRGWQIPKPEETTMNMHNRNIWKAPMVSGMLMVTCSTAFIGDLLAATPDGARPQRVVEFADLNVSRPQGITILYRRIEAAAHEVCDSSGERELAQVVRWHLCLDQAIANAIRDLSIPALTSYHLVKTGRSDALPTVARQP